MAPRHPRQARPGHTTCPYSRGQVYHSQAGWGAWLPPEAPDGHRSPVWFTRWSSASAGLTVWLSGGCAPARHRHQDSLPSFELVAVATGGPEARKIGNMRTVRRVPITELSWHCPWQISQNHPPTTRPPPSVTMDTTADKAGAAAKAGAEAKTHAVVFGPLPSVCACLMRGESFGVWGKHAVARACLAAGVGADCGWPRRRRKA